MKNLNLPTAIVLAVFIVGWVALVILGKPIPAWMAATAAISGKLIVSSMPPLLGAKRRTIIVQTPHSKE